jgi:hypothetical protein
MMLSGAFTVEVDTDRLARTIAASMVEQLAAVHFEEAIAHATARLLGVQVSEVAPLTEQRTGDGDAFFEREDPEATP